MADLIPDGIHFGLPDDVYHTFGAQDMFSDCENYQPGISTQVMK